MSATLLDVQRDITEHGATNAASLAVDVNCFTGQERTPNSGTTPVIPALAVFCEEVVARSPEPVIKGGATEGQTHVVDGQFTIRGDKRKAKEARAIGVELINGCHYNIPSGYIEFECLDGIPRRIQDDADGRPRFRVNWRATYEES